jgi:hypothetical protein
MDDERSSEEERPRPRVVDKRVSARPPGEQPGAEQTVVPEPIPVETAAESSPEPDTPAPTVPTDPEDLPPQSSGVWTPEQEEQARRIAQELARAPGEDLIVTFAMNFVEVASVKLDAGDLAGAQLAIDAFDGILNAVGTRLGEAEGPLRGVLAQLQMAYAQRASAPPQP